jgi:hypothetical protein
LLVVKTVRLRRHLYGEEVGGASRDISGRVRAVTGIGAVFGVENIVLAEVGYRCLALRIERN